MIMRNYPLEMNPPVLQKAGGLKSRSASSPIEAKSYVLDKLIMTDRDFEKMEWHDVQIHAVAVENDFPRASEFLLDLDYILKWEDPRHPAKYFNFWVAPATLVFEHVFDLTMRIESEQLDCQIDQVTREKKVTPEGTQTWFWTLKLHQGEITFWSTGYKQYFRRHPTLHAKQHFSLAERGGPSFARQLTA